MSALLDVLFQYRTLVGKLTAGQGLTFDEIWQLPVLESDLQDWAQKQEPPRFECKAVVRSRHYCDPVSLISAGKHGFSVSDCPYLDVGDRVEIILEVTGQSYRFKCVVMWVGDTDTNHFEVGLDFVGIPVMVRRKVRDTVPSNEPEATAAEAA